MTSGLIVILTCFIPCRHPGIGLFGLVEMRQELMDLLGRDVDLVCKDTLKRSHNPIRRRNILKSAQILYKSENL